MSNSHKKYYVVWTGVDPGVYDNWEDAQQQVVNFPGAQFKSFASREAAVEAYRGDPRQHLGLFKAMARHPKGAEVARQFSPAVRQDAIAVDGACSCNPGPMEYRGVRVADGTEIFRVGPFEDGTNNVGEYLAIIHALALLDKQGDHLTPIYSDSRTAMSWVRNRAYRSKLAVTPRNGRIHQLLERANAWIQSHDVLNPILKWDTDKWGEIPADFNRK